MKKKTLSIIATFLMLMLVMSSIYSYTAYADVSITGNPTVSNSFDADPGKIIDGKKHQDSVNPSKTINELITPIDKKKDIFFNQTDGFQFNGKFATKKQVVILVDTSGSLNEPIKVKNPFDYCLFSGNTTSEFYLHGGNMNISGTVHSNQSLRINASNFVCKNNGVSTDTCEYVTDKSYNGNVPADSFYQTEVCPMPDLSNKLTDQSRTGYTTYTISTNNYKKFINTSNGHMLDQSQAYFDYKVNHFEVTGDQFIIPDKTTYNFQGDLKISTARGIKFEGSGMLIATGKITLEGDGIHTSNVTDKEAFIYSCTSDIDITPDNTEITGILYAPQGAINIKGTKVKITGSVVADKLLSEPSDLNVVYKKGEIKDIIDKVNPPETYFSISQNSIKNALTAIKPPASVGILKYDSTANDNDFNLYDMNTYGDDLKTKIDNLKSGNSGLSNLGDALRRAYYMLNNSDPGNKYIIVFTGSKSNICTVESNSEFKKNDGNALYTKNDTAYLARSLDYAKEIGKMAENSNITQFFINYYDQSNPLYSSIDSSLKSLVSYIINKPETDSEISEYYFNPSNKDDLKNKLNEKVLDYVVKSNQVLPVKVSLSFTLPAGAKLNKPGALPGWLHTNASNPKLIEGSYDTNINWDASQGKFVFPQDDLLNNLSLNVKFIFPPGVKVVNGKYAADVDFINNHVDYNITYYPTNPSGIADTSPVKYVKSIPLNDLHTHVVYGADTN
ncbi:MAG: vWA domain-containing protein [Bacillota bacterium]|nr:vWA domain-containing protein [Bacillota bacterium]